MTRKRIDMKAVPGKSRFRRFLSVPAKTAAVMLTALLLLAGAAHAYTITVNPYPPLGPLGVFVFPSFAGGDPTGVYSIDWGDGNTVFQFYNTGAAVQPVVSHPYAAGGTYTVSFVYTGGGFPTVTDTITVAGPPDTVDPTVTILNPASDPFASTVPVATVTGTAADNVGVVQVTWQNTTTGASGAAAGTLAWTAAGIPLQAGANNIRIRAADAAGNTGTDTVTINYTSPTPAGQVAGATVTASPAVGTLIPGRDNVFSTTYRASGVGRFTVRSSRGTLETAGGNVLFTVNKPVEIRGTGGLGISGETFAVPAALISGALDRGENRIFYRRTFTGAVRTEVAFQVLPASAGPLAVKRMELNFLLLSEAGGRGR